MKTSDGYNYDFFFNPRYVDEFFSIQSCLNVLDMKLYL